MSKTTLGNWCYYKENCFLLVYGNKHIAMKIILMKSCRILEGLGREKNTNASRLLMRVYFTSCSREEKVSVYQSLAMKMGEEEAVLRV